MIESLHLLDVRFDMPITKIIGNLEIDLMSTLTLFYLIMLGVE